MNLGLSDKRALVLAGTRGLGRGIAEALAAEGATVALVGRNAETAISAAAEIAERHGGAAHGFAADLADPAAVAAMCHDVADALGGIDCLLLNSGGPPPGPLAETTTETWTVQFHAMVLSLFDVANAFLPGMRERGWGRILVSASSGNVQPIPNLGVSNVLRSGLATWVKTLSNELGGDGVTVNQIQPGRIHTERVDDVDRLTSERLGISVEDVAAAALASIPLARYGTVEEFAAAAVFLMSERASYITGTTLRVDGGYIKAV